MSKGIFKIARPGYGYPQEESKNYSFDSEYETPKVFACVVGGSISYAHNLGYQVQFVNMRNLDGTNWAHGLRDQDWYTYEPGVVSSGENFFSLSRPLDNTATEMDTGVSALLFVDPISGSNQTLTIDTSPKFVIKKEGYSMDNNLVTSQIDSRADTFKVFTNGDLTLSAPSVTKSSGQSDSITVSYAHNLGYVPFFTPIVPYKVDLNTVGLSPIPATVDINSLEDMNYQPGIVADSGEVVYVYITSTSLYLKFVRTNLGLSDKTFVARTLNMNYTIFYNDISEAFNLL